MEFARVGTHCSVADCHQRDFLPFKCARCEQTFCVEHRAERDHKCSAGDVALQNTMPTCPVCQETVQLRVGEDVDAVVSEHLASGCQTRLLKAADTMRKVRQRARRACEVGGCDVATELSMVHCGECQGLFCLTHRHPTDHACKGAADKPVSKQNAMLAQLRAEREGRKKQPKAKKKGKKYGQKGLDKIKAMRARLRATGDESVPARRRVSFEVCVSAELKKLKKKGKKDNQCFLMFFDRSWTVGKVLDVLCDHIGVTNRNHDPTAKHIVLVPGARGKDGEASGPLPTDVQLELLAPELSEGDRLMMRYE